MKLTQTRIVTDDVLALALFYERLTGVKPEGGEDYVEFDFVAGGLAICSKRASDMFNGGVSAPKANRSLILDFEVADVDHERTRLGEFIREFVLEPTNQPWGNRAMIFRDPDGNLVNFYTVIHEPAGRCAQQ